LLAKGNKKSSQKRQSTKQGEKKRRMNWEMRIHETEKYIESGKAPYQEKITR